jgi:hydroxymethylglutaryl-CoA lyase
MEKTIGRRLRSEAIMNGRIPKEPRVEFKRKGLAELKKKLREAPGQKFPADWPEKSQYKGSI